MDRNLLSRRSFLGASGGILLAGTAHAAQRDDLVILGLSQEPTVFHPLLPHIEVDDGVLMNLFSALWFIDEQGKIVPDLATEIPSLENGGLADEGRIWRVRLHPDAFWHDGRPVTADDLVFTLQTLCDPAFPAFTRKGFDLIDHVEQTGPLEVTWRMRTPYAPFMAILAGTMIVPAHILQNMTDTSAFSLNPVGSGPYVWDGRVPSEELRLRANPRWHLGKVGIGRAVIRYIPDITVMYTQFETGEIDYLGMQGIPPDRYQQAMGLTGRNAIKSPQPFTEAIALNLGKPQFQDIEVRHALYEAIDKQTMLDTLFQGIETPTESIFPVQSPYYNTALPRQHFDPAKAVERLERAGWRKGFNGVRARNGVKLEFTNATTSGNALRQQTQEVVQQNLADIGVIMHIENRPAAVMWGGYWMMSQFDSALVSIDYMTGSDPDCSSYFASDASPARDGKGQNVFQFADPKVDALFTQANSSFDRDLRLSCYREIQSILRAELPVLPIYQMTNIEGVDAALRGFASNVNVRCNIWNLARWYWA